MDSNANANPLENWLFDPSFDISTLDFTTNLQNSGYSMLEYSGEYPVMNAPSTSFVQTSTEAGIDTSTDQSTLEEPHALTDKWFSPSLEPTETSYMHFIDGQMHQWLAELNVPTTLRTEAERSPLPPAPAYPVIPQTESADQAEVVIDEQFMHQWLDELNVPTRLTTEVEPSLLPPAIADPIIPQPENADHAELFIDEQLMDQWLAELNVPTTLATEAEPSPLPPAPADPVIPQPESANQAEVVIDGQLMDQWLAELNVPTTLTTEVESNPLPPTPAYPVIPQGESAGRAEVLIDGKTHQRHAEPDVPTTLTAEVESSPLLHVTVAPVVPQSAGESRGEERVVRCPIPSHPDSRTKCSHFISILADHNNSSLNAFSEHLSQAHADRLNALADGHGRIKCRLPNPPDYGRKRKDGTWHRIHFCRFAVLERNLVGHVWNLHTKPHALRRLCAGDTCSKSVPPGPDATCGVPKCEAEFVRAFSEWKGRT